MSARDERALQVELADVRRRLAVLRAEEAELLQQLRLVLRARVAEVERLLEAAP